MQVKRQVEIQVMRCSEINVWGTDDCRLTTHESAGLVHWAFLTTHHSPLTRALASRGWPAHDSRKCWLARLVVVMVGGWARDGKTSPKFENFREVAGQACAGGACSQCIKRGGFSIYLRRGLVAA